LASKTLRNGFKKPEGGGRPRPFSASWVNGCALANPIETRPAKVESGGHAAVSPAWTHRFKKSGEPPEHKLFDQIWLSPALAPTLGQAFIDRRTKHGGDGSDHDPVWVEQGLSSDEHSTKTRSAAGLLRRRCCLCWTGNKNSVACQAG
jgi:hypothetical protein